MYLNLYSKDNKKHSIDLLLEIHNEVKHFYEAPIIFFTMKNYTDKLYDEMVAMRKALLEGLPRKEVRDIIMNIHLQWLDAVEEIANYKKSIDIDNLDRDRVFSAIEYTMEAVDKRLHFQKQYLQNYRSIYSLEKNAHIQIETEILEEMHKTIFDALGEKLKCFRSYISNYEFYMKLMTAISELEDFIDQIFDSLYIMINNIINGNSLDHIVESSTLLQLLVDQLMNSSDPAVIEIMEEIKRQSKPDGAMIRYVRTQRLEQDVIKEKLDGLNDQIAAEKLINEKSIHLKVLKIKKAYLTQKLEDMEKRSLTISEFLDLYELPSTPEDTACVCKDLYQLRIFNHFLPLSLRQELISGLCGFWETIIVGEKHKSVITILSASDLKEDVDEYGTYYFDHTGRKIYKKPDDKILYQLNEKNELVPLSDDEDHVYWYDDCGRYYFDSETRARIYKAHASASEYVMDSTGELIKIMEETDGKAFYFDNFGRYYIDEEGKHIYKEEDSTSEYEHDGLGNLVRVCSRLDIAETCPDDINVTEESKYLKNTVGDALRKCVAELVMLQPADPIKYLSTQLVKYNNNLVEQKLMAEKKEELLIEREIKAAEEREAAEKRKRELAMMEHVESEASFDSNLISYKTVAPDVLVGDEPEK